MKEPEWYDTFVTPMFRTEAKMGDRGQEEGEYVRDERPWRAHVSRLKGQTRLKERTMDPQEKATLYLRWHDGVDSDTHFWYDGMEWRQDGPPIKDKKGNEIQTIIVSLQE